MIKIPLFFTTLLFLCFPVLAAAESERATKDDAVAFVKKAVTFLQANGKEKAMQEFSTPKGKFIDKELYIVAVDLTGNVLAQGNNSRMIGKNLLDIKDADGKYFVKEEIELAKTKGKGWVDFKWTNPVSKTLESRSFYLERIDDFFIGSGIFKQ